MGEIRDMMGTFELYQPMELSGALDLLGSHGSDAWILSGGLDTFDWLKDRAKSPSVVVDVGGIEELQGIEVNGDGIRIGAMARLDEVVKHPELNARYPMLVEAAGRVATPQIRHQGTMGGNVAQDTRCWYYRSGWPCYRAGGNTCYANAPDALNREHAIFDSNRCVAVSPTGHGTGVDCTGCGDGGEQCRWDANDTSGKLLHRTEHGHHADDSDGADGSTDGDAYPGAMGGSGIVLREGGGPRLMGLCAGECGIGAGCTERNDPGGEDRGGRSGGATPAATQSGERDRRQTDQ